MGAGVGAVALHYVVFCFIKKRAKYLLNFIFDAFKEGLGRDLCQESVNNSSD